jgi:anti-sigma factor RsiW
MADCSNVEIRELLPERAGGALSAADIARVEAHLADCGLCTAELALIQAARRSLRVAPVIDVARIASGVVAATTAPSRPQLVTSGARLSTLRPAPRLRWVGWKAAAAIAIAAAGIGSFAVWQSTDDTAPLPNAGAVAVQPVPAAAAGATVSAPAPATVAVASAAQSAEPAELGVAGGLGDLSAGDLQSLLGDLGGAAIAADASFEEPEAMVPEVGTVNGWESL